MVQTSKFAVKKKNSRHRYFELFIFTKNYIYIFSWWLNCIFYYLRLKAVKKGNRSENRKTGRFFPRNTYPWGHTNNMEHFSYFLTFYFFFQARLPEINRNTVLNKTRLKIVSSSHHPFSPKYANYNAVQSPVFFIRVGCGVIFGRGIISPSYRHVKSTNLGIFYKQRNNKTKLLIFIRKKKKTIFFLK